MAIFGISLYGPPTLYGYSAPPAYSVDPFTATPTDYETIALSWVRPAGTITAWRLIKNMQGYPSDQNDGVIIVDSASGYPGSSYADINLVPGAYHYYGFFVQVNIEEDLWVGAGNTGCLMLNNYSSTETMLDLIPNFYIQIINNTDDLQVDPTGNAYLNLFMSVFGWGLDYLRTQYDTYANVNDATKIPFSDLYNLAEQLGLDINPAISPYTLRKAIYNNAVINKNKGTLQGLSAELAALTGWSADLSVGPNLMLSNDQSFFEDPVPDEWNKYLDYKSGELVQYDSYVYSCILSPNYGHSPSGTTSSNTWWQIQQNTPVTTMVNSATGGVDTWEGIYDLTPNTTLPSGALQELIGAIDPLSTLHNTFNVLQLQNVNNTTTDMQLRSVSRVPTDMAVSYPDQYQAIADGIPVPSILTASVWDGTVMYYPAELVTYNNQPFRALRVSVNSVPPYTSRGTASLDWEPIGYDERFRIVSSAYVKGSPLPVTPFIEWYDASGHFISRVFSRTTVSSEIDDESGLAITDEGGADLLDEAGLYALPANLAFDSFVTGTGNTLTEYPYTDDETYNWTTQTGNLTISPFAGGCAYPASQTRSIVTVNTGSSDAQAGLTFITSPVNTWSTGLALRYVSETSYMQATMTQLLTNSGGTFSVLGNYTTPCIPGDRVTVTLSGSIITVYRNGAQVLTLSSSFNSSATEFGIVYEQTGSGISPDEYTADYTSLYGS